MSTLVLATDHAWSVLDVAYLVGGILFLYLGAELLVKSASKLAVGFGVNPATVGVTVIAFATTAPELFVSMVGGIGIGDDIGLGNILGSNIANIGLVLGASALVRPMSVDKDVLKKHGPFMFVAAVLLVVLGLDGSLSALDGAMMLALLAGFTGYLLYDSRKGDAAAAITEDVDVDRDESSSLRDAVILLGAGAFLLGGSMGLLEGSTNLLRAYGFSNLFIALTVIAFGTSLPELATSVVSAFRGEAEFSIGNVIGSNIYNVLAVIGLLAIVNPLTVKTSVQSFHFPVLLGFTVAAIALMAASRRISRANGVLLLAGYAAFIYFLFPEL
ncbi:calcium/sodium antiporter [Halorussus salilacus]|uniref:calcium/sodium antiporter n=1 Tax=Halorussus salilacus TaxID=2953750 RepID=UPI00209CDF99|nr:calcium/sodium antiporter [Halorussus salilacus]USZ69111.1 calcium/sodium antiporter [Halorussus salilacus]